ncbi:MAG TPA: tetratricopeptide repeat protein [Candidatus Limnocylindrales bacterium]|nr:tetratricopeptide repeat protein [Candidatus Limnocylindrales bacterium]
MNGLKQVRAHGRVPVPRLISENKPYVDWRAGFKFLQSSQIVAFILILLSFLGVGAHGRVPVLSSAAEPAAPPGLKLPEIVITGEDKIKVKRKLEPPGSSTSEIRILPANGDKSRDLVKQGDLLYITDKDQARTYYLEAIQIDPKNATAYLRLGDLEVHQGNYQLAAENYEKAIQIDPNLMEAHYKLGVLYDKNLKNATLAKNHYDIYLRLGGKDPRVSYWLKRLSQ